MRLYMLHWTIHKHGQDRNEVEVFASADGTEADARAYLWREYGGEYLESMSELKSVNVHTLRQVRASNGREYRPGVVGLVEED